MAHSICDKKRGGPEGPPPWREAPRASATTLPSADCTAVRRAMAGLAAGFGMGPGDPRLRPEGPPPWREAPRASATTLPSADCTAVRRAMAGLAAGFGMGPGDPRLRGRARAGRCPSSCHPSPESPGRAVSSEGGFSSQKRHAAFRAPPEGPERGQRPARARRPCLPRTAPQYVGRWRA